MDILKKKPTEAESIEEQISNTSGGTIIPGEEPDHEGTPDPYEYGKNIPGGNEDIWHRIVQ